MADTFIREGKWGDSVSKLPPSSCSSREGQSYRCIVVCIQNVLLVSSHLYCIPSNLFRPHQEYTAVFRLGLTYIHKVYPCSPCRCIHGGGGEYCPPVRNAYSMRLNDLSNIFILSYFGLLVKTFSPLILISYTNQLADVVIALAREYLKLAFVRNHENGKVMTLDASMLFEHD